MADFYTELSKKINYSIENHYDNTLPHNLFLGVENKPKKDTGLKGIYGAKLITDRFVNKSNYYAVLKNLYGNFERLNLDFAGLNNTYQHLQDQQSKDLLVTIFAFKLLGAEKIKLPTNEAFIEGFYKCKAIEDKYKDKTFPYGQPMGIEANYKMSFFDHKDLGFDIQIFQPIQGAVVDFVLEQYTYKSPNKTITVEEGDVCIDAGGCWGDSALYFAFKAGKKGRVYSFEFISSNIEILNYNVGLNPHLKDSIELVPNPVYDKDHVKMYYNEAGPASRIDFEPFGNSTHTTETKTIDTLVAEKNLNKVDFIKMDIEGVEMKALLGSEQTIKKFRPKLAIAVYHKHEDFVDILKYIDSLNLGYKFYLGHYTIFAFETILYAVVD